MGEKRSSPDLARKKPLCYTGNMKNLVQDLKTGNFKHIYLLTGEEIYLRNQYKKKLQDALISPDDTVNINFYQGKGISVQELIDQAETMPFFSEHRLLMIEDSGFFKSASTELAEYLEQVPETTYFLFVENEVDKRGKLYKTVKKYGAVAEFASQTEDTLMRWILGILKKEQKNITRSTMELFLERTGTDMNLISMELEKLLSYTIGREIITAEDVEAICSSQTVNQIFEMIRAMAEKNQRHALELYYDLLALKEAPMRILYLIARQFNQIMQISELSSQGLGREAIAEKLGIQSFIVRNGLRYARSFSQEQLRYAVETAVQTETDVKTGKLDEKLAVELIIVEMSK